jgi:DedD protein
VVRLGAFASRQNANQLLERVRARGFPAYLEPVKSQGGEVVRVRGGPYPSPEAAQEARSRLLAAKLGSGDLKVVPRGQ